MKNYIKIFLVSIIVTIGNFLCPSNSIAQIDNSTLEIRLAFIDSLVTSKIQAYNVPGLTIAIVKDSTQIFYKGYGYADLLNKIPVSGENTGFKIASITKTFTAIAIMQLYENGKLDLHKDISHYLPTEKFSFLNDNSITIHQLLTHTAGFDFTDINDAAKTQSDIEPLFETIKKHMPKLVHPPGEVHSYSNFGYALLGYIIEQVTGLEYDKYLQKEIFAPLNMEHSSLIQPLPENLENKLSKSYYGESNQIHERDFTKVVPADGIISTGKDISNYMLALLNEGKFEGNQLLDNKSFSALTSQKYGSINTRRGICYSFFEGTRIGRRSLEHTGGAKGFASILILIPESGTGIFISHNKRKGAQSLRYEIARAILNSIIPTKKIEKQNIPDPIIGFESRANKYKGYYRQVNHSHSTFEKVTQLFGMNAKEFKVGYMGNNLLSINNLPFIPLSETHFIFDNPEHNWELEFKIDKDNEVNGIFNNTTIYEKIHWFQRIVFKQIIGGAAVGIILVYLMGSIFSRRKGKSTNLNYLQNVSLMIILSILFFGIAFFAYGDDLTDYGIPLLLKAALIFSSILAIISLWTPVYMVKTLFSSKEKLIKIKETFVGLSIVILILLLFDSNLLGFHF